MAVVVVVVVMLMMGVVVMLATAALVVMMLLMVVVMFAVVVVMVAAVVVWALLVNCLLRVGRAQTFEARSLGCALAAQEGHNVALVPFDGPVEGSLSGAALQGVRGGGGARKCASGTLALPVFGRHISPALYQQLHDSQMTIACGADERGPVAVEEALILN